MSERRDNYDELCETLSTQNDNSGKHPQLLDHGTAPPAQASNITSIGLQLNSLLLRYCCSVKILVEAKVFTCWPCPTSDPASVQTFLLIQEFVKEAFMCKISLSDTCAQHAAVADTDEDLIPVAQDLFQSMFLGLQTPLEDTMLDEGMRRFGEQLLLDAVKDSNLPLVDTLIKAGVDINAKAIVARRKDPTHPDIAITALQLATRKDDEQLTHYLLHHGANEWDAECPRFGDCIHGSIPDNAQQPSPNYHTSLVRGITT